MTKKFYKKTAKRRRKRHFKRKKIMRVSYPIAPARRLSACLKYNESLRTNLTYLVPNYNFTFRPNDLYDPNYSGAGHQQMFRDQLYAMYSFARCLKWSIKVHVMSDSDIPVLVNLLPTDGTAFPTMQDGIEYRNSRKGFVSKSKPLRLGFWSYVDKFLENRRGTALTDDQFKQPQEAALPFNSACFMAIMAEYPFTSGSANIWFNVSIKTYCVFCEQRTVTGS